MAAGPAPAVPAPPRSGADARFLLPEVPGRALRCQSEACLNTQTVRSRDPPCSCSTNCCRDWQVSRSVSPQSLTRCILPPPPLGEKNQQKPIGFCSWKLEQILAQKLMQKSKGKPTLQKHMQPQTSTEQRSFNIIKGAGGQCRPAQACTVRIIKHIC